MLLTSVGRLFTRQLLSLIIVSRVVLTEPLIRNLTGVSSNGNPSIKLYLEVDLNEPRRQRDCDPSTMRFQIESNLTINQGPRSITTKEGGTLDLKCKIECNSTISPSSLRLAKLNDRLPFVSNQSTGRLYFERVDLTHSGRYICYTEETNDTRPLFQYLDVIVESSPKPTVHFDSSTHSTTPIPNDFKIDVKFYLSDYRDLKCETDVVLKNTDSIQLSQLKKIHDVVVSWHLNEKTLRSPAVYTFSRPISDGIYVCTIRISDSSRNYYLLFRNGRSRSLSSTEMFGNLNVYDYNKVEPLSQKARQGELEITTEITREETTGKDNERTEIPSTTEFTTEIAHEQTTLSGRYKRGRTHEPDTSVKNEFFTTESRVEETSPADRPSRKIFTTEITTTDNGVTRTEWTKILDEEEVTTTQEEAETRPEEQTLTTSSSNIEQTSEGVAAPLTSQSISRVVKYREIPDLNVNFSYKIERQFVTLSCSTSNGIQVEYIEIRKKNGRRISSVENSSSLQVRLRKWQIADEHVLYCTVQDGPVTKEESFYISID